MACAAVTLTTAFCPASISISCSREPSKQLISRSYGIHCSSSGAEAGPATCGDSSVTGGAYDFTKATTSLTNELIVSPKKVTLIRHGLSTWNAESRIQGSSDLSILTDVGVNQAERCKKALENIHFDVCFASPISRAKQTAEIIWQGNEKPLVFLDSLKELSLCQLEGMKNVDAKRICPEEYTSWREDPANFIMNGRYPVRDLWDAARVAWKEILLTPGESFLVVTHKSILRALTCTALGLGPERFRALDINNGGICVFNFNVRGEAMLKALNLTAPCTAITSILAEISSPLHLLARQAPLSVWNTVK